MIGEREELEYFINECKSYNYYRKKVLECNLKLEEINTKLEGLSSPAIKDIIYENASDPYREKKTYWICEEDKVKEERDKWQSHIDKVDAILNMIPSVTDKSLVIDLYIKKKNADFLANEYCYAERSSLYRHVKKELRKILKWSHVTQKTDV